MRQKKLALDREQRMARLREEIKREDETLATLDKQQSQDQSGSDEKKQSELEKKPQETIIEVNQEELEGLDEEEKMRRLLGFNGFGSTKGQAVDDNQSTAARGGAAKNKARKYRQYMNRKNGFNRPLEKMK
jgi:U4/U6.U5 tri-snRNP-associated protein 3